MRRAEATNPDLYTEDGYEDETISVRLEHREMEDGTKMHIAYVEADSDLRKVKRFAKSTLKEEMDEEAW